MSYQNGMLQDAENAKNLNNVKWTQPNLKLATTSITNHPSFHKLANLEKTSLSLGLTRAQRHEWRKT